ncbi:MAG TPA: transglycosylase domain-containing protein, partial [Elusimicrobiota bacterium]|nr:transglycosylase domain-containing protein [Elusimicrobiota bacterium]
MRRVPFYLAVVAIAAAIVGSAVAMRHFLDGLPPFYVLEEYTPSLTTRVYDVHEELLAELSIEKRALLSLPEIPKDLQNAVIATEDSRFYEHWGISPYSIMRAAVKNFIKGRVVEGASTLTQQLSKLIFLTPQRK